MNALYKIDHKNSSVELYGSKKGKGKDDCLCFIEEKLSVTLEQAVLLQSELFHHCSNMLSPVMDVAEGLQDEYGDINVQSGRLSDFGLYSAQTCVNAFTRDFHTEFDQGPTLICVPDQKEDKMNKYNFCFHIISDTIIQITMTQKLIFVFSAFFLTHRQECKTAGTTPFVNICSFCNKKLFSHVRKSYAQVKGSK